MKKLFLYTFLIAVAPLFMANAQDIIKANELAKIMKNDDVVVVSTRTAADYKKVHINGAVHINHSSLYKDGPVKNMLKSPQEIAKILGDAGISESKKIVLDIELFGSTGCKDS